MNIESLHWDDGNVEHIARHGLSTVDIEDICFGEYIAFRGREKRYVLYGKTGTGAMIMVVLEQLYSQTFRPITARPMTEKEKHSYRKKVGE